MIKFFNRLFNRSDETDEEPPMEDCKTCEVLKQQLKYERSEKLELLETLTGLLKPQVIIQPETNLKPITPRFTMFSRRRQELEKADAMRTKTERSSPHVAKSDQELTAKPTEIKATEIKIITKTVDELEKELGIGEVVI